MSGRVIAVFLGLFTFGAAWFGLQYYDRSTPSRPKSGRSTSAKKATVRDATPSFAVAPGTPESWFVMRLAPFDEFMKDYEYMARLCADDPLALLQLELSLKQYTTAEIHKHIDVGRPIGAYAVADAEGKNIEAVLMLPVISAKSIPDFVNFEKKKPVEDEAEPGLYRVRTKNRKNPEQEEDYYLRYAHNYAYGSSVRDLVAPERLLPPDKVFTFAVRGAFSANLRLAQMPKKVKDQWLQNLRSWELLSRKDAVQPGLLNYFGGVLTAEYCRLLRTAMEASEASTVHVGIDRKTAELSAEWILTPKPESALAQQFAALAPAKSRLAAVPGTNSALSIAGNLPLPEDLRWVFAMLFAKVWEVNEQGHAAKGGQGSDDDSILRSFTSTMTVAGYFDGALALRGPDKNGKLLLIGGLKVFDGPGIDAAIRKRGSGLAVARMGAVPVYRLSAWGGDATPWGDPGRYVAVGSDTVWAASGEGAVAALQQAVSAPAREVPLFELALSVSRLHALQNAKQAALLRRRVYGSTKEPADRVRLTLTSGPALTWRLAMPVDIFKYIHLLTEQKNGTPP